LRAATHHDLEEGFSLDIEGDIFDDDGSRDDVVFLVLRGVARLRGRRRIQVPQGGRTASGRKIGIIMGR